MLRNVQMLSSRQSRNGIFDYESLLVDAWKRSGGSVKQDIGMVRKLRAAFARVPLTIPFTNKSKRLLICASWRIDTNAWPWNNFYEIVPVMWDVWPSSYDALLRFISRNSTKLLFCTSSQMVSRLSKDAPHTHFVWMPEAIDVSKYPFGAKLSERGTDILEYGRKMQSVHNAILSHEFKRDIVHKYGSNGCLFCPDKKMFRKELRDSKIAICYPKCDTSPEAAGGIETLTLRYWECMCSGTLMVGRAPRELIDLCGYNPCVELSDCPSEQIEEILDCIGDYQELINRNRSTAERIGDWSCRIDIIKNALG